LLSQQSEDLSFVDFVFEKMNEEELDEIKEQHNEAPVDGLLLIENSVIAIDEKFLW